MGSAQFGGTQVLRRKLRTAPDKRGKRGNKQMGKRLTGLLWVLTVMVGLSAGTARADEVIYKKHTVVDFGADTIEGDLSKPDGQYLESRKRLRHQRLIKVRENFRPEILQSVRGL